MKYQLDLHLECLRQAFNTCYYCAAVFDYPEELERRCVKHVRRANEKGRPGRSGPSFPFLDVRPTFQAELNNARTFDDKISFLVEPDKVDANEHGLDDYAA
jgi:hypothetical protein